MKKVVFLVIFLLLCIGIVYAQEPEDEKVKEWNGNPQQFDWENGNMDSVPWDDPSIYGDIPWDNENVYSNVPWDDPTIYKNIDWSKIDFRSFEGTSLMDLDFSSTDIILNDIDWESYNGAVYYSYLTGTGDSHIDPNDAYEKILSERFGYKGYYSADTSNVDRNPRTFVSVSDDGTITLDYSDFYSNNGMLQDREKYGKTSFNIHQLPSNTKGIHQYMDTFTIVRATPEGDRSFEVALPGKFDISQDSGGNMVITDRDGNTYSGEALYGVSRSTTGSPWNIDGSGRSWEEDVIYLDLGTGYQYPSWKVIAQTDSPLDFVLSPTTIDPTSEDINPTQIQYHSDLPPEEKNDLDTYFKNLKIYDQEGGQIASIDMASAYDETRVFQNQFGYYNIDIRNDKDLKENGDNALWSSVNINGDRYALGAEDISYTLRKTEDGSYEKTKINAGKITEGSEINIATFENQAGTNERSILFTEDTKKREIRLGDDFLSIQSDLRAGNDQNWFDIVDSNRNGEVIRGSFSEADLNTPDAEDFFNSASNIYLNFDPNTKDMESIIYEGGQGTKFVSDNIPKSLDGEIGVISTSSAIVYDHNQIAGIFTDDDVSKINIATGHIYYGGDESAEHEFTYYGGNPVLLPLADGSPYSPEFHTNEVLPSNTLTRTQLEQRGIEDISYGYIAEGVTSFVPMALSQYRSAYGAPYDPEEISNRQNDLETVQYYLEGEKENLAGIEKQYESLSSTSDVDPDRLEEAKKQVENQKKVVELYTNKENAISQEIKSLRDQWSAGTAGEVINTGEWINVDVLGRGYYNPTLNIDIGLSASGEFLDESGAGLIISKYTYEEPTYQSNSYNSQYPGVMRLTGEIEVPGSSPGTTVTSYRSNPAFDFTISDGAGRLMTYNLDDYSVTSSTGSTITTTTGDTKEEGRSGAGVQAGVGGASQVSPRTITLQGVESTLYPDGSFTLPGTGGDSVNFKVVNGHVEQESYVDGSYFEVDKENFIESPDIYAMIRQAELNPGDTIPVEEQIRRDVEAGTNSKRYSDLEEKYIDQTKSQNDYGMVIKDGGGYPAYFFNYETARWEIPKFVNPNTGGDEIYWNNLPQSEKEYLIEITKDTRIPLPRFK